MNEPHPLAENQLDDSHYLRSVTQLGDTRRIVANRDIHSTSGMKLISAGMKIDSSLYDRLLQHKLVPPLDDSLSTEDTVTGASLAGKAMQMMKEDKQLESIQSTRQDGLTLPHIFKKVTLHPAIAFKLTVMRETNSELYQHSIYVALVGSYIGVKLQLHQNQLRELATATLLHDIGMLHLDPAILARDYKMSESERRHLYVHTVTGAMILKAYPEYTQKVVDAVLQHHEHLDGSGYPRGLKNKEISLLGQITAIAEIVASQNTGSIAGYGGSKLETILKLNMRRYGGDLVRHLRVFYQDEVEAPPCSDMDKLMAQEKTSKISAIFSSWENNKGKFDAKDPVSVLANERMLNLKMEVIDAGLNPTGDNNDLFGLQDDLAACFDARILLDETLWQLRNILLEIKRRVPSVDGESSAQAPASLNAWVKEVEALL
ncbi:HD-GYP domain-containing protein [Sideroxydans lithotrophicus]|uniref:Metal dependent phosphohydrolase n=1 Tax=Sideroxydans lithotrophicus (strain ES-1) TaxID=580332 RepID=D5CUK0_SIDLE|nr:HD domain-containing phosphohydrolase [Sideroxydans lithotrophicus]ADE12387.1 metal dependent phosphohydrolase [Sideroxydans lithotrophicus ES-1]